ncbi:MAG: S-layer y protein, partial [Paenibacillaceae bacterium]|nr:S-layer y protein [Paenibacillaceae bacterium]
LRYTATLDDSSTYDLYTVPVAIQVAGQPAPATLQVEPAEFRMEVGADQTVTSVTYKWDEKELDVTASAVYTVRDNTVASVNAGVITGLKAGSTILDVVYGQTRAEAAITVTAKSSGGEEPGQPEEPGDSDPSEQPSTTPSTGVTPPAQPANTIAAKDGKVESAELEKAFASHSQVEIKLEGSSLAIPASGLLQAANQTGKQLVISGENGVYHLPLAVIKLDDLARRLNTTVDNLTLQVSIRKLNETEAAGLNQALVATGGTQAAVPLDFELQAAASNGQTVKLSFGSDYVTREMSIHKTIDPRKATAAWFSPEWGGLRFVPSLFSVKDGKPFVEIKRTGNSVYTVVEHDFRFADMSGHWAVLDVELLANKLIVEGTGNGRFEGDRTITRAEFAALLVRALGLSPAAAGNTSKDVASEAWYAKDVATAAAAGLINGYDDGSFRPDRVITREELAALSMRALAYTGTSKEVKTDLAILGQYKDAAGIVWAKEEIAAAITLGLMNGTSVDALSPEGTATRAESAAMLKRLLVKARFINE